MQVAKGTSVAESQKKFWSTKDAGQQPFTYKAGVGGVITGWDHRRAFVLGSEDRRGAQARYPRPAAHEG